jgi:MarR family transcriptional regulator, transcriptional regulator for hemolysin
MKTNQSNNIEPPLGRILSQLGKNYLYLLNSQLNHLDITRSYFALLLIESGGGFTTQQELAGLLETDKVSMVRVIDYLSDNGYVQRAKNVSDKRKYRLVLTPKAIKVLPEIKRSIEEVNRLALKNISPDQIEIFFIILEKIKNNLKSENKSLTDCL